MIEVFEVAKRFIGLKEILGEKDNPFIQWCLTLCDFPVDVHDEVPWCSAFVNGIAFICGFIRSGLAAARSWLLLGKPVLLKEAEKGDIVILKRGKEPQPDASVVNAQGHVGFFAGMQGDKVLILGGNQGNQVSILPYPINNILGIRRLT
jgi:uncharacterized protein (TIGR02594 family)